MAAAFLQLVAVRDWASRCVPSREPAKTPGEDEKESRRWFRGLEQGNELSSACPGRRIVVVGDRESDIFDLFRQHGERSEEGVELLVRVHLGRQRLVRVWGPGCRSLMIRPLRDQPDFMTQVRFERSFEVDSQGGRRAHKHIEDRKLRTADALKKCLVFGARHSLAGVFAGAPCARRTGHPGGGGADVGRARGDWDAGAQAVVAAAAGAGPRPASRHPHLGGVAGAHGRIPAVQASASAGQRDPVAGLRPCDADRALPAAGPQPRAGCHGAATACPQEFTHPCSRLAPLRASSSDSEPMRASRLPWAGIGRDAPVEDSCGIRPFSCLTRSPGPGEMGADLVSQRKMGGPTATSRRLFQPSWQPPVLQRTTPRLKPRRISKLRSKLQSVNSDVALERGRC